MDKVRFADRRNTDSVKWDGLGSVFDRNDLLPLWVADMDFEAPDCVASAIINYAKRGVYGYYKIPGAYYDAFISWESRRFGFDIKKEWIMFSPGVVSGLNWAICLATEPGDAVIVLSPVYYPFLHAVENNNRKLIESELICDDGVFTIDFDDFERKIEEEDVKCFILCSPHNPVGRVWRREELDRLFTICRRHNTFIISDEIHQDFVFNDNRHIPSLSVGNYDDIMIALTAPSKTFNLAGLQNSIVVIPDEGLRRRWNDFAKKIRILQGNSFGYIAARAAYAHGEDWLDEVKNIIYNNYTHLKQKLVDAFPEIKIAPLEGTYLMWLDLSGYVKPQDMHSLIQDDCGLALDFGEWFGGTGNETSVRINLATSGEIIEEAGDRLINGLRKAAYI